MLSSKWNKLNHNCQKFNAIYKRCSRLTKSGESELDVMKRARMTYHDENRNTPFTQEDAWELLRGHAKWDAYPPAPVDLTEDEDIPALVKPIREIMTKELRLKREAAEAAFEVAKEKDRMVIRLEEMKFLAISTKDLSKEDAYFIEEQKKPFEPNISCTGTPKVVVRA
nr:endopeptidase, NLPC/P60 domain, LRAT-like domain protein [Tanacetum cinerariifolium]